MEWVHADDPRPGAEEVRVRVSACGVCRTDLHVAEGDLPVRRPFVIPGHEIVGTIDELGAGASRFKVGERVGVAWLGRTCRRCRFCVTGRENLCLRPRFTGWEDDGGYAEMTIAHQDFVYSLPHSFDDEHVAPLLCAGIIGYRALRLCQLPPAGVLGIYGFGGSAHLAAQIAIRQGARVHVVTRSESARKLALTLGAASASDAASGPPEALDSAILFAPAGEVALKALRALDRGGTLAIAGIHLTPFGPLSLPEHLYYERRLVSVTANTRQDGEEFLTLADRLRLEVHTQPFTLDEADAALRDLAHGRITGAAVLRP
ncbi:MAG: zinc-dependent alcohol dehydrogenase family protein [Actinomycetota bacterium]|nr:zinc-dependent alcohol dehydrogenase family protein [Actinomycetota bacterium]